MVMTQKFRFPRREFISKEIESLPPSSVLGPLIERVLVTFRRCYAVLGTGRPRQRLTRLKSLQALYCRGRVGNRRGPCCGSLALLWRELAEEDELRRQLFTAAEGLFPKGCQGATFFE